MAQWKFQRSVETGNISLSLCWILFSCILLGLISCKGKGTTAKLSKSDSVAIYKYELDLSEKIYYLKLSSAVLESLFTPKDRSKGENAVKQLHFEWHEYPGLEYGLDAYGADENGNRLNDNIALEIALDKEGKKRYVTNTYPYVREKLMILTRGDLKYLLNSEETNRDTPIESGVYQDIIFSPEMNANPGTAETMFFSIKKSADSKTLELLRGTLIYTNPSPPARPGCELECDY